MSLFYPAITKSRPIRTISASVEKPIANSSRCFQAHRTHTTANKSDGRVPRSSFYKPEARGFQGRPKGNNMSLYGVIRLSLRQGSTILTQVVLNTLIATSGAFVVELIVLLWWLLYLSLHRTLNHKPEALHPYCMHLPDLALTTPPQPIPESWEI